MITKRIHAKRIGELVWVTMILIAIFAPPCIGASPPITLTPKQLVALSSAAKQRYWSLSYSLDITVYPYVAGGKAVANSPSSVLNEKWRWTPWRIYYRENNKTYTPGAAPTQYRARYLADGTTIRSVRMQLNGGIAHAGNSTICQISNGGRLGGYGVLPELIWPADLEAGVTDSNSKVTWNAKSKEYRLNQVSHVRSKATRYITWIDPNRGFIVIRRQYFYAGKLFRENVFSGWHQLKPGMWLPSFCSTIIPGLSVSKSVVKRVAVINMPINRLDMRLKFPPGATLYNLRRGRIYQLPAGDPR